MVDSDGDAPSSELVPADPHQGGMARTNGSLELKQFETVVSAQLTAVGLPAEGVFVDVRQRVAMLAALPDVIEDLEPAIRAQSLYISKMIAAGTVGLFDAALNYLWDELVAALRRRVAGFDLKYFYDIAAPNPDLRKQLRDESDMKKLDDQSLLRAAHEIGLLTDVGHRRLDHVRWMRNHASAAHPNQAELTGLDLANWLETCIREVITTPPDTVTATTGRLLGNIKKGRLDDDAVRDAAVFFDQLPGERADTLANGLFGLYVDPARAPHVADNVRVLWPRLWPFVGQETRISFGLRHARALASLETDLAASARELLDLADGTAYLTEEVRAVEMADALDQLMVAHHGWNNFYNESTPARRVAQLAGEQGDVPEPVRIKYVKSLVQVFLGNGHGVANAVSIYSELIQRFGAADASIALRMYAEPEIAALLRSSTGARQWGELLAILAPKVTSNTDRALLAAIQNFTGAPDKMILDTEMKKLARQQTG